MKELPPQFDIENSTEGEMKVEGERLQTNLADLGANLDKAESDPALKEKILEKLMHPLNLPALAGVLYTLVELPQEDLDKALTGLAIGLSTTAVLRLLNFLDKRGGKNSFA